MISFYSISIVWMRYFAVFRKNIWYGVLTTFVEPILYLTSFGFGLGGMIGTIDVGGTQISYRAFVLAGIVGQSILFTSFFESAYGAFVRMYYQKIFQAIAITPVTLSEVMWGELIWGGTRTVMSSSVVLLLGALVGDFNPVGAACMVIFAFFAGFVFAALGLLVAATSRSIESISYPQLLFVFPMFLFCGVYFPISNLPGAIEMGARFLPLTAALSIIRWATLGFPFEAWAPFVLLVWGAIMIPLSRRMMIKRLLA